MSITVLSILCTINFPTFFLYKHRRISRLAVWILPNNRAVNQRLLGDLYGKFPRSSLAVGVFR